MHPATKTVTVRMPAELHASLMKAAGELRLPLNQIAVAALAEMIDWPQPNPPSKGRPKYRQD